jgi:hypothetical protein
MIPLLFLAMAATGVPSAGPSGSGVAPKMEKLLQDCDAHKFETVVNSIVEGKPHQSKVKLCGTKGQDDAAWVNTLKDAVAKVKANDKMPAEIRDQIASALDAEIIRLGTKGASMALVADSAPSIAKAAPGITIASLAPRPAPGASTRPLSQDYGSVPPLPEPKAVVATSIGIGSILPSLPPPRMTLHCGSSDDPSVFDSCGTMRTDTILLLRADEQLPAGTSLRFVRRDDNRGQVALASLRSGQTARIPLPHRVCDGVVRSEVQIEVLRKPAASGAEQVVDTLGPYDLRC